MIRKTGDEGKFRRYDPNQLQQDIIRVRSISPLQNARNISRDNLEYKQPLANPNRAYPNYQQLRVEARTQPVIRYVGLDPSIGSVPSYKKSHYLKH